MALIGSIENQGTLQGQINDANGYLTGVISNAGLLGGQVVAERGLKGDKGDKGDTGATGSAATVSVGSTTTGAAGTSASVSNSGTSSAAIFDFIIPQGDKGDTGATGAAATIAVGTTSTGAAGTSASVVNSGTSNAAIFDFTIPKGDKGDTGNTGSAATIAVGSVATGAAGTSASIVNSGTSTSAIFDFTIPKGDKGDTGSSGHSPVVTASKSDSTTTIYVDGSSIATIDDGADGVVQDVEVNGTSVLSGTVAEVTVPTKVSDLNNDSKFITSPNIPYLTCATAGSTAAKTTTLVSGTFTEADLVAGAQVLVKFTNANGKANPTLSVNGTTAKTIYRYGTTAPSTSAASSWNAGSVILFTYDGSYWQMQGWLNSTYSEISEANITNATGSSTGLATGRRVKKAVETFAPVSSVNGATGAVTTHDVPSGGSSGQALTKNSNDDYDLVWATVGGGGSVTDVTQNGTSVLDGTVAKVVTHDVPSGGTGGQFLVKNSGVNYDIGWTTLSVGVVGVLVNGTSVVESGIAKVLVPVSDVEVNGTSVLNAGVASVTVPTNVSDLNNDSGYITGVTSTSTPTASTISEFDANAKMNSTDMTTGSGGEVETFVNSLSI